MENDCICALSTPSGRGALGIIRLSGEGCVETAGQIFVRKNGQTDFPTGRICYGEIRKDGVCLDEAVLWCYRAPHSFTGEDMVEISCHGSGYILQQTLELLLHHGCRMAEAGEFTRRAFLNGKLDLTQAEAVADLIASDSAAAHQLAMRQLKGGFSTKIGELRKQLVHVASLLELELDFGEEDVEFAERPKVFALMDALQDVINRLCASFRLGNVFKNGIPVAIAGRPNVGKSTLLNRLLGEERAIVSDIPGTTRDTIEDVLHLGGHCFRFIDTAGLRESQDVVENFGIERSYRAVEKAMVVLYMSAYPASADDIRRELDDLKTHGLKDQPCIVLLNKADLADGSQQEILHLDHTEVLSISAKHGTNVDRLLQRLENFASQLNSTEDVLVSNLRHYEALRRASESLTHAREAMEKGVPTEFVMTDIHEVIRSLGSIVGEVTSNDILGAIFSQFCIGK